MQAAPEQSKMLSWLTGLFFIFIFKPLFATHLQKCQLSMPTNKEQLPQKVLTMMMPHVFFIYLFFLAQLNIKVRRAEDPVNCCCFWSHSALILLKGELRIADSLCKHEK